MRSRGAIAVFGHDPRVYCTTVKAFVLMKGNKAVVTVELKPEKDEKTGRTVMTEIPDSEKTLDCSLLLIAAGFLGPKPYIAKSFGAETDGRSNIATAAGSYKTSVDKLFTAGDCRRGQSLVVWAIAEGRAAAKEIDEYLRYTNRFNKSKTYIGI
ncbi:MAG: FAD-dependent oxidoreductase [Oscillospiraceae bacterium]